MLTSNQLMIHKRCQKIKKNRASKLKTQPHVRGIVLRVRIQTPKKPNSARRPVCRVALMNKKTVIAHVPGGSHNLRKHSQVLIEGVGCKDLPGVNYTCVRGVYDFSGMLSKLKRRSIYGTKLPDKLKKKLRRKFRQI